MADFVREIIRDFKEQYPKNYRRYEDFLNRKDPVPRSHLMIEKEIMTYCDMMLDLQFLIDLTRDLENEEEN